MAKSILSKGQQRLAWVVLSVGGFILATSAYLWVQQPPPDGLSPFYQAMLWLHVDLGKLLLVPMGLFVLWHLKRALAMRNLRGNLTGILVTVSMVALFATGLLMDKQANSDRNRWAYITHQALALVVPLGYLGHRLVAKNPISRSRVLKGTGVVVVLVLLMLAGHAFLPGKRRPPVQPFVTRVDVGSDPYTDFPDHGVSGAEPNSAFRPAATRTQSGGFLANSFLVNDDLPEQKQLESDIEQHGFAVEARLGSRTCEKCHPDVVEQWARSAHRYSSFNNPFYRAAIEKIRDEKDGKQRSQWCAGCHDPAVMMPGNMLKDIDPLVPESQAGLTCLLCHAMDEVHGVGGNGNYRIADLFPDPYLFAGVKSGYFADVNERLMKAKPDVHKRDMLKPFFRTSEYCATCHKVSLDTPVNNYRWMRGQNQYDGLQDSGVSRNNARTFYLPPSAKTCQDCHMPMVKATRGDLAADADGMIRSHVFPGANTGLPFIRGDHETLAVQEASLKECATVDVFAVAREHEDGGEVVRELFDAPDLRDVPLSAGETIEMQVVVRNRKVGHLFPAGTTDSNEAWVEFTVFDPDAPDTPLYESGRIDPVTRYLDPSVHDYRTVFVDEHSQETRERDPQNFRAKVHQKLIGPGTADIARYRFEVPPGLAGKRVAVRARLLYRKFNRYYTEFTYRTTMKGRPVPELPVTEIHAQTVSFPVVAGPAPRPAPIDPAQAKEPWTRWNDWGIGLLFQGDTRGAEQAFAMVRDALPGKPDGWRNLARVHLRDGDVDAAVAALQEAEKIAPDNAQTAYFFGKAREQAADQLEEALEAYERAKKDFPGDRTIHRALGQIHYRLGRYDEALADFLEVLRIDPEDREAHYGRFLIYTAQGKEKLAAAAEKAYLKFQIDESAQRWTNEYRRANPEVNRESQSIHTHDLEPLR